MGATIPLLVLLLVANASPLLVRALFGRRFAQPLDGGRRWRDGQPLLGPSKTWRGAIAAVSTAALAAPLLGLSAALGALIGAGAMLGDALSSFAKRRLGLESGAMAPGLDHLPEALLPLLACAPLLDLTVGEIVVTSLAFMAADLLISRLADRLGIGDHPH